jgi:hypothetical protein
MVGEAHRCQPTVELYPIVRLAGSSTANRHDYGNRG